MSDTRYLDHHAHDLALLATGEETGWWDDTGRPAPWPNDFWLADGTINPDWRTTDPDNQEEHDPSNEQPF
ncbi:MAG: hypothetical protein VB093_17780 [Propionicimonas sp.]|nr:hypothetical protein [Propionicimonas sp.]